MGDWNLSPEVKISAITNKDVRFSEYHINHFEREKEPSKQAIWKTGVSHFKYIAFRRFTEDSKFGGLLYKSFINKSWVQPKFRGQKVIYSL